MSAVIHLLQKIETILNGIRPAVRAHGGEILLMAADESSGIVRIKFQGACQHCVLGSVTLKLGLEPLLKKNFPWITSVVAE